VNPTGPESRLHGLDGCTALGRTPDSTLGLVPPARQGPHYIQLPSGEPGAERDFDTILILQNVDEHNGSGRHAPNRRLRAGRTMAGWDIHFETSCDRGHIVEGPPPVTYSTRHKSPEGSRHWRAEVSLLGVAERSPPELPLEEEGKRP
jgi:hypothetical protein